MSDKISPTSVSKTALPFGLLFGILLILETVIFYVADIDPIMNPTVGTVMNIANYLILPPLLIYIACNSFKKLNSGFISFGECLKSGVIVCIIAALLFALFSVAFNVIFPEYMDEILSKTKSVMIANSPEMTSEQVEMALSVTKKFMSPMILIPATIAIYAFIGLIHSLIIGAIVKKDKFQSL